MTLVTVFRYVAAADRNLKNKILGPLSLNDWTFGVIDPDGSGDADQFLLYAFEEQGDQIVHHFYPNVRRTPGVRHPGHDFETEDGTIYTGPPWGDPKWTKSNPNRDAFLKRCNPEDYDFVDGKLIKKG